VIQAPSYQAFPTNKELPTLLPNCIPDTLCITGVERMGSLKIGVALWSLSAGETEEGL